MARIAEPRDYWIAPNAIYITRNALGDPDRIQGNVAAGAAILCYMKGVQGLEYDNGHNYKSWPLSLSPTYFNTTTPKYIYAAIPKTAQVGTQAVIVFPSKKLDVYGITEPTVDPETEEEIPGEQIGSTDYYYIWLQGILSASEDGLGATQEREWLQEIQTGLLSSDEALASLDTDWYSYSQITSVVTFLKEIAMSAGAWFRNLIVGSGTTQGNLTGVATDKNGETIGDMSEEHIVTPSYVNNKFLRKDKPDTAKEIITFEKGAEFGKYVKDASGAKIDSLGDAEFREIRGREALIVPEVRFELAKGVVGVETQCSCGGQIDEVFPNQNQQGEQLTTGGATLMLEEGEIGRLEVGDLCMGVWHRKEGGNAPDTSDDRKGNFAYQGFSTIYFRITDIPDTDNEGNNNSDRHYFEYELRPMTTDAQRAMLDRGEITAEKLLAIAGGNGIHPYPLMHFYGRGNSAMYEGGEKDGQPMFPERQKFTLRTPEYIARLTDVSNWYFGTLNYTYVNGNLTGFDELLSELGPNPFGNKEKFGTIDCSLWMKGTIVQLPNAADFFMIAQSKLGLLREDESETVSFKVLDTYRNNKTDAYTYKVYCGETQLSKTITVSQDGLNATFTLNYSDLNGQDSATFRIRGTEKSLAQGSTPKVIEETFLVMKNAAERGEDAVVFIIQGEETAFHINKSGAVTPLTIPFRIIKITGSLREDKTDEYTDRTIVDYNGTNTQYDISTDEVTSQSFADNTTMATVSVYEEDGFAVVYVGGRAVAKKNGVTLTPLAVATFSVVRDGSDGINVVVADFDDEMHSVACNTDGTPIRSSGVWNTFASMYLGPEQLKLKSAEIVTARAGISVSLTSDKMQAKLTVNYYALSAVDADSLSIRVKLTADNNQDVGYATATVIKVKAGEDGKAMSVNIVTEPTVINVNNKGVPTNCFKDNNGYYIKAFFNVSVNEQAVTRAGFSEAVEGVTGVAYLDDLDSDNGAVVSGEKIYIQRNSGYPDNEIHPLGLELRKYYGSQLTVLDMENIPIVRDGSDGITGTSTTLQYSQDPQKYGWHTGFQQDDVWARAVYTDGEGNESYGAAFRIVGENGANGDYVDYAFAISAEKTTANSTTSPSDISTNQWSDVPQLPTAEKPFQWMRRTPVDGTTKQQKAGEQITYIRLTGEDGADGADGVSSYTWLRYSEDGETFTRRGDIANNILKDALFEADGKQDGSAIGTTSGFQKWFKGGTGSAVVRTSETEHADNLRRVRIQAAASGTYNNCDLKQAMNTLKPNTWYTLRFQARAVDYFITYITYCVDTTQRVIVDGREVSVGGDMAVGYYPRYEYVTHTISFKTKATLDTSSVGAAPTLYFRTYRTGVNISAAIIGSVTTNNSDNGALDIVAPTITEGKHDYTGENLFCDTKELVGNGKTVKVNSEATRTVEDDATVLTMTSTVSTYKNIVEFELQHIAFNSDYVFSFEAKGSGVLNSYFYPTNVLSVENSDGYTHTWTSAADGANSVALTNQWKRYWVRWRTGNANTATGIKNVLLRVRNGDVNTASIRLPKLELGSVATPWSPSQTEQQFGTAEGAWLGTLVWEHPYPSNNFGDYTWTRIKGDDGQKGGRGAMIRSRGEYVATEGGVNVTYLAGGENEEYLDVVICSNGLAYQCQKSHGHEIATDDHNYDPITDTTHWQQMNNFENVATKVLFAQLGYVENLGVRYVETTNNGQGMVSISDGVMEVFNAFGSRNIRFGIDENGYAVMQYFDNNGTLLYDLGPNGLSSSDVRNAVLSRLEWKKFTENSFGQVIQNNIVAIFTPSESDLLNAYYFLCKINAGVKVADDIYATEASVQQYGGINSFDQHYFKNNNRPLVPQNYLGNGFYYQPTRAKFGSANTNIKMYNGYGGEDMDYTEFKGYYPNNYKVTWPTSATDLMNDPLLYMEVYQINTGGMARKVKVFMRLSTYRQYIDT